MISFAKPAYGRRKPRTAARKSRGAVELQSSSLTYTACSLWPSGSPHVRCCRLHAYCPSLSARLQCVEMCPLSSDSSSRHSSTKSLHSRSLLLWSFLQHTQDSVPTSCRRWQGESGSTKPLQATRNEPGEGNFSHSVFVLHSYVCLSDEGRCVV